MTMPNPTASPRILLLDDDGFMLRLLTRMLEQIGYTNVLAFEDGPQALQELRAGNAPIDLIVLDLNMPGMDGIEFIRRLAEYRYAGSVVLASGENSRILDSVNRLLQLSNIATLGHLQKPVQPQDLKALVERLTPVSRNRGNPTATSSYRVEELRTAIARGELVNYYQPKVSLTTGELVGVESLVRWQHPHDGLVFPDRFLSMAAENGMMTELTRAVLPVALRQVGSWSRSGRQVPIAVNVSMDDLRALDFPDVAASIAAELAIEPSMITLEITEGQVMGQLSTALDVISRLRLKRFRLAIDDFGTGYSSLAQLRDLPFDELKIDRGFVHGAARDVTLRAICSASLRMAQQLQLHVVAEGIEDREDWDLLRELGCDDAQGYFIARPMPAADLGKWMDDWLTHQRRAREAG
jgi:EAL domain-containing protein (putative c-di-GMP-specific phosphodiesterase class I)/FixJ family two-component response regulator